MDLSLGTSSVPPIPAASIAVEVSSPPLKPLNPSTQAIYNLTLPMLLSSSFSKIQAVSIFVVIPRYTTGQDREEKSRADLLRKVRKVAKSSQCDQQNKK
ncbi:MAG: hypothetical protein JSR37_00445 [Verrucomicrobia bacterium]|nr:hypothetical protein [Verrucomicrobiota bacterium]MBS0637626.1 hypothetical protein [Verrucomicrobiota bacterium]